MLGLGSWGLFYSVPRAANSKLPHERCKSKTYHVRYENALRERLEAIFRDDARARCEHAVLFFAPRAIRLCIEGADIAKYVLRHRLLRGLLVFDRVRKAEEATQKAWV